MNISDLIIIIIGFPNERSISLGFLTPRAEKKITLSTELLNKPQLASLSQNTKRILFSVAVDFETYLDLKGLETDEQSIRSYLLQLKGRESTINTKKYALKKLLKASSEDLRFQHLLDDLFKQGDIKAAKIDQAVRPEAYLTEAEIKRMVAYGKARGYRMQRTAVVCEALFQTACRISELFGAKLEYCSRSGRHVLISVLGKGRKTRTVYLKKESYEEIRTLFRGQYYLFESERGTAILPNSFYTSLNKLAKKAGVDKKFGPHIFRHSKAMQLINKGTQIQAVSQYLGHSDISTTIRSYLHHMPSAEMILD